jgi:2-polyprenyl-3-methyl-5-hydroxy-6-metoxy-1,4-benzoquinol methylase
VTEREHYSYTLYADPSTARSFDARRFGGPIGELVAAQQAQVLLSFLEPRAGQTILDVGTGTGRGAFLLAGAGATVTGVDASKEMLAVALARAGAHTGEQRLNIDFREGDAHALDFPDRSFDVAVSLRVLMHTPRWRTCVAELCRVARRHVLLDFPSARSTALLQSVSRKLLDAAGGTTEPYRVFFDRQIVGALEANGFRVRAVDRQFVLPIALHKAIGSPSLTRVSERLLARIGAQRAFGSPVTILAERCEPS